MTPPFPQSYWLEPAQIVCGEYPRTDSDSIIPEKTYALLRAGVRVFVDLTEPGELKPYREMVLKAASDLGIDCDSLEFHRHGIVDVSIPRSRKDMLAILETIEDARSRGKVAYIHCWGGRGRTGTVASCWLLKHHQCSGEEALAKLQPLWKACSKSSFAHSPETEEQRTFVRNFS